MNERRSEHSADEGFDFGNYHPLEEVQFQFLNLIIRNFLKANNLYLD